MEVIGPSLTPFGEIVYTHLRNSWRVCVEKQEDDQNFNPPRVLLFFHPKGSNT
jgi:hypothetical protein